METSGITIDHKIVELERELQHRLLVYPRQVRQLTLTKNTADRRIEILREIVKDYKALRRK